LPWLAPTPLPPRALRDLVGKLGETHRALIEPVLVSSRQHRQIGVAAGRFFGPLGKLHGDLKDPRRVVGGCPYQLGLFPARRERSCDVEAISSVEALISSVEAEISVAIAAASSAAARMAPTSRRNATTIE